MLLTKAVSLRAPSVAKSCCYSSSSRPRHDEAGEVATVGTDSVDYFQLLNLPQIFDLSPSLLQKQYKTLMSTHHPDRKMHTSDNTTKDDDMASRITHAYDTLKQPHLRAAHLLEVRMKEAVLTEEETTMDDDALLQVMETRQRIDDTGDDPEALQRLWDENEGRLHVIYKQLSTLLDGSSDTDRSLSEARRLTSTLQYWVRVQETLRDKME